MNRIYFSPNIPITLELLSPEGDYDFDLQMGRYQTTDGREFALPRPAVVKLNQLGVQPGEQVGICHRIRQGEASSWDLWLTRDAECARAEAENTQDLTPDPQKSIAAVRERESSLEPRKGIQREIAPSKLFDRGTGTDGPQPQLKVEAKSKRNTPTNQIPWNVAFREVTRFVTSELKSCGEQWSDQAKQDAICSVLISAARQGYLGMWERGE